MNCKCDNTILGKSDNSLLVTNNYNNYNQYLITIITIIGIRWSHEPDHIQHTCMCMCAHGMQSESVALCQYGPGRVMSHDELGVGPNHTPCQTT